MTITELIKELKNLPEDVGAEIKVKIEITLTENVENWPKSTSLKVDKSLRLKEKVNK